MAAIIDDLIVYYLEDSWYRMVVNAGTRDKDLAWLREQAGAFELSVEARLDLAMIAVQGPNARARKPRRCWTRYSPRARSSSGPFVGVPAGDWFVARTGYTGEDGWEIMLPAGAAADFWARLHGRA